MLNALKNTLLNVEPQDVIDTARNHGIDVASIQDFRKFGYHYYHIDEMMDYYCHSFARLSVIGGLTTGIGGLASSVTFAALDTISLSIQLYRLSQRFAILNGFDGSDPIQKNKIMSIYFESLGINAVLKAALKQHLLKADRLANSGEASETLLLRIIINVGEHIGQEITSKDAARMIPVIGGIEGAVINYTFAHRAGKKMKTAYKRAYFKKWQCQEIE